MDEQYIEILGILRARGALNKDEILDMWNLTEEGYADLRKAFKGLKDVEPGPRRIGGFRIKTRGGRLPRSSENSVAPVAGDSWQAAAVGRLCELLQHKELEDLLGDLVYTVRLARKASTGEDRRGTKEELAQALVIKHEIDLFRDNEVRDTVAKCCKLQDPGRWHLGKPGALRFVREANFPIELAGIPSEDPPEDFEYLEGRVDLKPLQDFQDEVKRQVLDILDQPNGRAIITLPTGAGKTRVAVEAIRDWLTARYHSSDGGKHSTLLWLAHSGELCEQAYLEFRQIWQASYSVCPLLLFRFWGRFTQDLAEHREPLADILRRPSILISTPQRLVNLIDDDSNHAREVLRDVRATACLVVIDEAHRAAAPSYKRILGYFSAAAEAAPAVVGLTATPFRMEYMTDAEAGTLELAKLFGTLIEAKKVLGNNPREILQARRILARPMVETVKTATILESPPVADPDSITDDDIERIDRALSLRADNPQRRLVVFKHILPICRNADHSILYFGPSILDAECMAFLLRQGVYGLSFKTRRSTRRCRERCNKGCYKTSDCWRLQGWKNSRALQLRGLNDGIRRPTRKPCYCRSAYCEPSVVRADGWPWSAWTCLRWN